MKALFSRTALIVAAFSLASFAAVSAARADSDPAKEMRPLLRMPVSPPRSTDMKDTQMHLHHVVNCLVGPKGKGFDATPGNPCKDQGNGAITDTKDSKQKKALQAALAKANAGLKAKDMTAAQKDATDAQAAADAEGLIAGAVGFSPICGIRAQEAERFSRPLASHLL